jgi:alkylation response protein AidB-like acyl-CoA dehydrogenase
MSTRESVVDRSAPEVIEGFGERAAAIDAGHDDVRAGLRELGSRDLLATADFTLIEQVSAQCLSSGFALWAHRMVIEYLAVARPDAAVGAALAELSGGTAVGSTAMAPALREVAGIEPVPVLARPGPGGSVVLSGDVRWASLLFPGAYVVLPARFDDDRRIVAVIGIDDPGVTVAPPPRLLALGGTATSSLRLDEVRVPGLHVLSWDMRAFVGAVRPTFLLLQSAFCSGLASRSLGEVRTRAGGPEWVFDDELDDLTAAHRTIRDRYRELSENDCVPTHRDLLRLRLDAMSTAVRAVQLELSALGGRGYLADSPTARRLREAAFLPVQSPTEAQLRWELSRCDR